MDGQRFDALARSFGRRRSRRAVVRGVAGGTVAAGLGLALGGVRPAAAGGGCDEGLTDCSGVCVDLATDMDHCGACDAVCESGLVVVNCIAGVCSRVSCPAALPMYCGELGENDPNYVDNCVDPATDPNNCGACGNVCESGECADGACVQDEECEAGLTDCGGVCVDLATDMDNCGACGEICESSLVGVACLAGECVRVSCPAALPLSCGDPIRPVEEHCFDPDTDPNHCGECFNECASGVCDGGVCVSGGECDAGETDCDGICVDLSSDLHNCGACGNSCVPAAVGVACIQGECVRTSCPAALPTYCGELGQNDPNYVDNCVDLSTDPRHCGACGNDCGSRGCFGGVCTQDVDDDAHDDDDEPPTTLPNTGSGAAPAVGRPKAHWAPAALAAAAVFGATAVRRALPGRATDDR
jgi:hypothetical protein